jgi:acyl dehydratase
MTSATGTTVITDAQRHPRGGIYFDDFAPGQVIKHRITRSVTQMDNVLFSTLTMNPQPLHIDRQFAEASEWGQPLMNSLFTLGLVIGISVGDTTNGTLFANLGMTDVKFPHPLFENDTVHCESTIVAKRESKSRPTMGVVEFHHRAYNQHDKLVAECVRQSLVLKREA